MSERVEMLRGVGIFRGLGDETLERIAAAATEVTYEPGQVLIEEGTAGSGMFVLLDGSVSVHGHGFETEVGAGEVVGEFALVKSDPHRIARVSARTPVRALALARQDFRALLEGDAGLAVAVLENVANRLAD